MRACVNALSHFRFLNKVYEEPISSNNAYRISTVFWTLVIFITNCNVSTSDVQLRTILTFGLACVIECKVFCVVSRESSYMWCAFDVVHREECDFYVI